MFPLLPPANFTTAAELGLDSRLSLGRQPVCLLVTKGVCTPSLTFSLKLVREAGRLEEEEHRAYGPCSSQSAQVPVRQYIPSECTWSLFFSLTVCCSFAFLVANGDFTGAQSPPPCMSCVDLPLGQVHHLLPGHFSRSHSTSSSQL